MTDYHSIYAREAEAYDRMVTAEDCDDNLGPALSSLVSLDGARVVEVGAGTGRLTRILLARGARVDAFEPAPAMLEVARRHLGSHRSVRLEAADGRALPVEDASYDAAFAGWVFGHLTAWEADWQAEIARGLAEMKRAVKPGGMVVVIETLGTGTDEAAPPNERLAAYYGWLEEQGFSRRALRTDYAFEDAERAAEATGFFFGEAFADAVRRRASGRIIEHTGVWSRVRS